MTWFAMLMLSNRLEIDVAVELVIEAKKMKLLINKSANKSFMSDSVSSLKIHLPVAVVNRAYLGNFRRLKHF